LEKSIVLPSVADVVETAANISAIFKKKLNSYEVLISATEGETDTVKKP
jgi:hypothetical protein